MAKPFIFEIIIIIIEYKNLKQPYGHDKNVLIVYILIFPQANTSNGTPI